MKKIALCFGAWLFAVFFVVSLVHARKVEITATGEVRVVSPASRTVNADEIFLAFSKPGKEIPIWGKYYNKKVDLFHYAAVREHGKTILYDEGHNKFVIKDVEKVQEAGENKFNPTLLLCAGAIVLMVIVDLVTRKGLVNQSSLGFSFVATLACLAGIGAFVAGLSVLPIGFIGVTMIFYFAASFAFVAILAIPTRSVWHDKRFSTVFYIMMTAGVFRYIVL